LRYHPAMPRRARALSPEDQLNSSIGIHAHHLLTFLRLLASEEPIPSGQLEETLGVSDRTVRRYKEALEREGFQIETRRGQGYQLKYVPAQWLPFLPSSVRTQIMTLGVMTEVAALPAMQVQKVATQLLDEVVRDASRDSEALRKRLERAVKTEAGLRRLSRQAVPHLKLCLEAIVREKPVAFRYIDSKAQPTERVLEPHGCLYTADTWYVIGYDRLRKARRNFALERMQDVRLMHHDLYKYPEDFDINKLFRGAWGIWRQDGLPTPTEFVVDPQLAQYFGEIEFPTGEKRRQRDGRLRVKTSYADVNEAARWLAPYADAITVVYPDDLKNALREKAQGILSRLA